MVSQAREQRNQYRRLYNETHDDMDAGAVDTGKRDRFSDHMQRTRGDLKEYMRHDAKKWARRWIRGRHRHHMDLENRREYMKTMMRGIDGTAPALDSRAVLRAMGDVRDHGPMVPHEDRDPADVLRDLMDASKGDTMKEIMRLYGFDEHHISDAMDEVDF